jgi:hypothetical protein
MAVLPDSFGLRYFGGDDAPINRPRKRIAQQEWIAAELLNLVVC